jgi:hypothetical protein
MYTTAILSQRAQHKEIRLRQTDRHWAPEPVKNRLESFRQMASKCLCDSATPTPTAGKVSFPAI